MSKVQRKKRETTNILNRINQINTSTKNSQEYIISSASWCGNRSLKQQSYKKEFDFYGAKVHTKEGTYLQES